MNEVRGLTRRAALGSAVGVVSFMVLRSAEASGDDVQSTIRELVGDARVADGGLTVRLPEMAENGAQVPVTITVDTAQTEADHVRAIHLVATRNPTPGIATFHLGPRTGRASVTARIRLAESQTLVVLAHMNDGSVRRVAADVRVTVGGCLS